MDSRGLRGFTQQSTICRNHLEVKRSSMIRIMTIENGMSILCLLSSDEYECKRVAEKLTGVPPDEQLGPLCNKERLSVAHTRN